MPVENDDYGEYQCFHICLSFFSGFRRRRLTLWHSESFERFREETGTVIFLYEERYKYRSLLELYDGKKDQDSSQVPKAFDDFHRVITYSHLIRFRNRGCCRFEPFMFSVSLQLTTDDGSICPAGEDYSLSQLLVAERHGEKKSWSLNPNYSRLAAKAAGWWASATKAARTARSRPEWSAGNSSISCRRSESASIQAAPEKHGRPATEATAVREFADPDWADLSRMGLRVLKEWCCCDSGSLCSRGQFIR